MLTYSLLRKSKGVEHISLLILIVIVRFKPAFQRHLNVLFKQLNYFCTTKNYSACHSAEPKSLTGEGFCISCANGADASLSSQNAVIGLFSTVLVGECEAGIISGDTM
jgi:hypothetical protein